VHPRWILDNFKNVALRVIEDMHPYGLGHMRNSPLRNRSTRYAVMTLRGLPSSTQAIT
jgi:hypothetical protein